MRVGAVRYQTLKGNTIQKPSNSAIGAWTKRVSDVFSPPPSHSSRFQSDHLDEIHAYIATYDGTHRRAALGHGPLGYSMHAVRCGGVDLGWGLTRARQMIRGVPQDAILHLPLGRRQVYAVGGRTLEARPDTAVLLAPGQEYTLYFEPDNCLVVLRIPGSELADELVNCDPGAALANRYTREIPLAGGRLSALAALHRALVDATKPTTGSTSAPPAEQLEARLCSWMAGQLLGARPSSSTPTLGIQRVRTVEEWIDAHLADPITLGCLCAVAGVGDRYLESAFRAHRGQTPLQFVTARRLAWVRRSLLESKPGDSVTQLAHNAGFVHLGRFAARYRSTYCESPSATLRRRLDRS
jgi:AraC-like DNA-binding protein